MECKISQEIDEIKKIFKNKLAEHLKQFNLTPSQNALIVFVHKENSLGKEVTQKDIENEFLIKASSVNSLIQNLEKKNFIIRKICENDKRKKYLKLTEKSEKFMEDSARAVKNVEKTLINGISNEELEYLNLILNKMKNNLLSLK